jgi:hypothetical protein
MERGLSAEEIVEMGADFLYEGQPIAIGIQSFHNKNIKLIHQELQAPHETESSSRNSD